MLACTLDRAVKMNIETAKFLLLGILLVTYLRKKNNISLDN